MTSTTTATAKILVVDDDPSNISVYSDLLRSAGHTTCAASNRFETLAALDAEKPDIVLLDVNLGAESGLEIMQAIKGDDRYRRVFVVLISAAYTSPDHRADGLESGADGYITRPIETREFLARIGTFLRHKETIDSLRKSEHRFRAIVESNPDAILIVDDDGTIRFANRAAERLFKRTVAELQWGIFGHPLVVGEYSEIQVVRDCDGEVAAEMRATSIEWDELECLLTSIRDISDRKRMERALRESEMRHKATLDSIQEGVVATDCSGRIIRMNPAAESYTGWKLEDALGRPLAEVYSTIRPVPAATAGSDQLDSSGTQLQARDGTVFEIADSAAPIRDHNGEVMGEVIVFRDVTDQIRAQRILSSEVAQKRVLLRELYHRTKNNMQVISAMLNLRGIRADGVTREILEDTRRRILTMSLVHEQLYESEDLSHVDLAEYLSRLVGLLREALTSSETVIEVEIDCADVYLSIDTAIPLGQVLNELMSNSAKHAFVGRPTGKIAITVTRRSANELQIDYHDDGRGMPDGFDLQADGSLGTEIIRLLTENQLQGSIQMLESAGTSFRLIIPAEPDQTEV